MKKIVIAIDGYSACGKSSTAKQVAEKLGYTFIDSGAMYRAVTLFFLNNHINIQSQEEVESALENLSVSFDGLSILLNDIKVDSEIRTSEVNKNVSAVSALSSVRKKMVSQQQEIGRNKGVVMDGRDIGTVVFPDAELKVFMTANIDVRAARRMKELREKGVEEPIESITANLLERDRLDSTRQDSPLRKAEDAIEIDTTHLTLVDQVDQIVEHAKCMIHED